MGRAFGGVGLGRERNRRQAERQNRMRQARRKHRTLKVETLERRELLALTSEDFLGYTTNSPLTNANHAGGAGWKLAEAWSNTAGGSSATVKATKSCSVHPTVPPRDVPRNSTKIRGFPDWSLGSRKPRPTARAVICVNRLSRPLLCSRADSPPSREWCRNGVV